jgi:hypothetical protein
MVRSQRRTNGSGWQVPGCGCSGASHPQAQAESVGVRRLDGRSVAQSRRSSPPGGQRRCLRSGSRDARVWVLVVLAMTHLVCASRTNSGWGRLPAASKAVQGLESRRRQARRQGVLRLSGGADVLGEATGALHDLYTSCRTGSASSGVAAAAASYARGCLGSIASGETHQPVWQGALVCCRLPNSKILCPQPDDFYSHRV